MEGGGKVLLATLIFALCLGIGVVLLDKSYRPAKIAETNRGVFSNIPSEAPPDPQSSGHPER